MTTSDLARYAKHTTDTVALADEGFYVHVDTEMMICSMPDFFDQHPLAIKSLNSLIKGIPATALPLSFAKEKGGAVSVSFGGLIPSSKDTIAFEALFNGLTTIEEFLPDIKKQGDAEAYVFGRNGDLNPGNRMLTAWGRSPMEAVAKLYAHITNGFNGDEKSAFETNIHADGDITMRSLHDWSKHPIKEISARLKDELDIYLDTKNDRSYDISVD